MSKRKRESSAGSAPVSTPTSIDIVSKADATVDRKGESKDINSGAEGGHKGPRVLYIAAEGSSNWTKSLDLDRNYAKSLKHIAKKLGVPKEHSDKLRLTHVRDGGREVDLWDDIDYQAFKTRATASPGSSLTLKVYGVPGQHGSSAPTETGQEKIAEGDKGKGKQKAVSAPVSVERQKKEKKQSTTPKPQASSSSAPQPSAQSASMTKKQIKQASKVKSTAAYTLPQIGSASSPSPQAATTAVNETESTKQDKSKDKKRKSNETSSAPSPAPSAPYTPTPISAPSPFNAGRPIAALNFAHKYMPARPSPLGPNRVAPNPQHETSSPSSTATPGNTERRSATKRDGRRLAKRAVKEGSIDTDMGTPLSTPQPASVSERKSNAEKRDRKRSRRRATQKAAKQGGDNSDTSTPRSAPHPASAGESSDNTETKDGDKRARSDDQSPPKKRVRKSSSRRPQSIQSSPASTAPAEVAAVAAAVPAVDPLPSTASPNQIITARQTAAIAPSPKQIITVSNEEYDLKQKPKESTRKSSSITGEKKKPAKQSAVQEVSTQPTASTSDSILTDSVITQPVASTSTVDPSTTSTENTVIIPESPPTVTKPLPAKKPVGRPKKAQVAEAASIDATAIPTATTATTSAIQVHPTTPAPEGPSTPATTKKGKAKATATKVQAAATPTPTPVANDADSAPSTGAKGKAKATPKPSAPAVNSMSTGPPVNDDTTAGSTSPPASSADPPSSSQSATKKKVAKPKKIKESSGDTEVQQILQRQREKLAAIRAARAAAESAETASSAPAEEVVASSQMDMAVEEPSPAAESSSQTTTEAVIPPAPVIDDVPAVPTIEIAPQAEHEVLSPVPPVIRPPSPVESSVVEQPIPLQPSVITETPVSEITVDEPIPSAEPSGGVVADEAQDAMDDMARQSNDDVEMREATPEHAPPAEISASPVEEDSAALDTPEADTRHIEAEQGVGAGKEIEAEDIDESEMPATQPEPLVPESETPQPSKVVPATASSKSRGIKGRNSLVPCVICLRTPWHYQKDCPEVKAGADSLRYLLSARRDQHESLASEDDGSHFDQSIEAIQEWVERLESIAGKVQGVVKKNGFKPRSPVRVMGSKDGQTVDLNAPLKKSVKRKADETPAASTMAVPSASSTSLEVATTQVPDNTASTSTQIAQTPPDISPESPSIVPDTYNFPPIHLRAMRKSHKPGSHSGLSVSDALIETEPSDDSSSEDDDNDSDNGDDENDERDDGSESDTSSVVSSTSAISSDSDVSSESGSATSRVAMPSDPSDAMRYSLTRDLSEREKKKARLSAAKMQPATFDEESVIGDDDHQEDDEEEVTPPTPATRTRAGSDSSIGDFGEDASRRSSIDSTITAPYRSQAPPVIASSAQPARSPSPSVASEIESNEDMTASGVTSAIADIETPGDDRDVGEEGTPSTLARLEDTDGESNGDAAARDVNDKSSGQMSRSFRDIDMTAASSPDLDDSAGLEAVQQGIADEEEAGTAGDGESQPAVIPIPTQSLSQARRTRRSSVLAEVENAPLPASQPLRRSSRTSVPPQEASSRRLRSVSREVQEKTPPPPMRSSRSTSRSMASMSPSTPKARRASNTLPRVEEGEIETPKQATPRRTRSTRSRQPDQPESSLPIEESSQLQPTAAVNRQTQPTPVRRSTRTSPSPLFMTQGSQFPATQFYDANPETLATSESASQDPTQPSSAQPSSSAPARGRGTRSTKINGHSGLATSPIIEEQEHEHEDDDEDQNMSPVFSTPLSLPNGTQASHASTQQPTVPSQIDADGDVEMSDAQSRASDSSDDENDNDLEDDLASIPDIQPPKPRNLPLPSSQASNTTPIYPSLSSLPKDFLRNTWNMISGNGSSNGPATPVASRLGKSVQTTVGNAEDSDDDSGSSSDSSVERAQAPPSVLKGRFASGGMERKKTKGSQPAGW